MDDTMQNKVLELAGNEEYMEHLLSLSSLEEMSNELAKEDVDLSPEELKKIGTVLKKKESGELTDEELEEVAGGFAWVFGLLGVLTAGLVGKIGYHVVRVTVCDK